MADPRFFSRAGPFSLAHLASHCGAKLASNADGERLIHDVGPFDAADDGMLVFVEKPAYLPKLADCAAGAVIMRDGEQSHAPDSMAVLLAANPYRAYALVAQAFYPPMPVAAPGHAASASIAASARIGEGVRIGPGVVIEADVEIGAGTQIAANSVIGVACRLGEDCRIADQVSLSHCLIGDRVTIHPGARIGQDGFGFAPDPSGHVKLPQLGRVIIGNDCDIGANASIDRGTLGDTVLADGCWIDNLVQIGHNVQMGRGCVVVAQAGISGSTKLGNFVMIGGQAGLAGHLKIGDGARIAAQGGVIGDVPAGALYGGFPARPLKEQFREIALLRRLAKQRKQKQ